MKNLFKICLLLSVFVFPQISHSSVFNPPNPPDIEREIDLEGNLGTTPERSLLPKTIYATISFFALNAEFSNNLGDISIEVCSPTEGIVYENTINTKSQQKLSINISNWDYGIYEIRFTDSNGKYLYGTFEVEL